MFGKDHVSISAVLETLILTLSRQFSSFEIKREKQKLYPHRFLREKVIVCGVEFVCVNLLREEVNNE